MTLFSPWAGMTDGQCDANVSQGFLLKVCMGIVAVAGMPETRINLNFVLFFLACFGWLSSTSLLSIVILKNSFPLTLSPGRALNF
jgi:hypothetical protein